MRKTLFFCLMILCGVFSTALLPAWAETPIVPDTDEQTSFYYFRAYPLAERGYALIRQERFADALPLFRRAVDLLPTHLEYRIQLIHLLLLTKGDEEAKRVLDDGLAQAPEHTELLALKEALAARHPATVVVAEQPSAEVFASTATPPAATPYASPESHANDDVSPPKLFAAPQPKPQKVIPPSTLAEARPADPCAFIGQISGLTPVQHMEAGYCALNAGKDAYAIRHFQVVAQEADGPLALQANKQLGYLYGSAGQHTAAARSWRHALAYGHDDLTALFLARSLRLDRRSNEAQQVFNTIRYDRIEQDQQTAYASEGIAIAEAQGDTAQAIAMGEITLALHPTADAHYYQAIRLQRLGKEREAIRHLEEAHRLDPQKHLFQVTLAYAYRHAEENAKAIPLFAAALEQDPAVEVREDYAYALKHESRRPEAAEQFRQVLPGVEDKDKAYLMRRDIQQLEDRWTHVASVTYRDGVAFPTGAGASGIGPISNEESTLQYGLESVYAPADWQKYRRRAHLYGQIFTSAENGKLDHNDHSTQMVLGARATPLPDVDWFLYAARLVAGGNDALDDWQFRSTYGYTQGFDYDPNRAHWPYFFVSTDASYLLHEEARFASVEGRYGHSFKPDSGHWVFTPHLVGAVSHQKPENGSSENSAELGAGLSLKYWFDETAERAPRGSAELLLQWREPVGGNSGSSGGPFLRLVLQY